MPDWVEQVVIDVEKGLVEGPIGGPAHGSNEYCAKASDWMRSKGAVPNAEKLMIKIIQACSTLTVSERAYDFDTTATVYLRLEGSGWEETGKYWASGSLNRITGELTASSYSKHGNAKPQLATWKMNCVAAQSKF